MGGNGGGQAAVGPATQVMNQNSPTPERSGSLRGSLPQGKQSMGTQGPTGAGQQGKPTPAQAQMPTGLGGPLTAAPPPMSPPATAVSTALPPLASTPGMGLSSNGGQMTGLHRANNTVGRLSSPEALRQLTAGNPGTGRGQGPLFDMVGRHLGITTAGILKPGK